MVSLGCVNVLTSISGCATQNCSCNEVSMDDKQKKISSSAIITAAIAIVAVAALFFVVMTPSEAPQQPPKIQRPPEIEKSISGVLEDMTWTTMRDERLGFEISIPTWFEPSVEYAPMCTTECYGHIFEDAEGRWSYIDESYRELPSVDVWSNSFDSDLDMDAFWVVVNQFQDTYIPGPTLRDERVNGVMLRREIKGDVKKKAFNERVAFFADGRYHVFEIYISADPRILEAEETRVAVRNIWNTMLNSFTIIEQ